jgi:PII-like signaling protein
MLADEGVLLRIFVVETDKYHGRPVYEEIVLKARELGIAGATVLRGVMGFGAGSTMHTAKLLRLSEDLPLVIEIVDTPEKINKILVFLDEVMKGGLVTEERVRILRSAPGSR